MLRENESGKRGRGLAEFARDLTAMARMGQLDPCDRARYGDHARGADPLAPHEEQPCAYWRAGCGQDGGGGGLAQKIAAAEVPDELMDKRLLSLDLSAMVAGTRSTAASLRSV